MKPRALFIGRFQPCHKGHLWLFEQKLAQGIPILIAIRDMNPDAKNPFTAKQSVQMIETIYAGNKNVSVMIIPDIESVNYGRGVGYEINAYTPPETIGAISATQIRDSLALGKSSWKEFIPASIQVIVEEILNATRR